MENSGTGVNVLVAEKDPALLRETFSRFDYSDILSNDRFLLGTGEPENQFFAPIQGAALTGVADINSLIFSPLHKVDELYYDKVRNELVRQYLVIRPLMEVNVRTATNLQENTLQNLPHMINAPDIGEFKDKFQDISFILIGAGPSLDESIDFLKEVQDKAIIVASNSPYRKLINNGIRPHLVVTADPMEPTLSGFQKHVSIDDVPLASSSVHTRKLLKVFGQNCLLVHIQSIASFLKEANEPKTWNRHNGTGHSIRLRFRHIKSSWVPQSFWLVKTWQFRKMESITNDSFYSKIPETIMLRKAKGQQLPATLRIRLLLSKGFSYT